jgi:O-antigen/teichoic acid export membrane protein
MISKSFLKSSFIFTIGGALPMIASIILLPFYTNQLSPAHYTQVVFYISISLLFQILFSFSIETYFGIKYSQLIGEPEKQKKFTGTVALLLLFIGGFLLLFSAIAGAPLFKLIYREDLLMDFWPFGFYSIVTAFFNSYFKAASICLIYLKQRRLFLFSNLINFIATVVLSVGGLYLFPDTIIGPVYGRLISGAIIFIIGIWVFAKNGILVYDNSFLKELIAFCMPYMLFVLFGWVLGHVDRYILQSFIENQDLNTYDLILKCFFGIEFLQNSLSAVIFPKIYEIWGRNKELATTTESNRYFNVFTVINILQLILFCLLIPLLFKLLIKNDLFYESEKYIGLLAGGYALRSILNFYLASILFTKKVKVLLKIFGFSALFQILITVLLIPSFGVMGAVFAGLLTKILQIIFCMIFTKTIFKYEFNFLKIIVLPFIYILVNVLQFYFYRSYSLTLYAVQLIIFGFIFYLAYKNEIRKLAESFNLIPDKK